MRLAVFGGSGRTGRRLIEYALAAGHEVTALMRRAPAGDAAAGLTIQLGDVLTVEHVRDTIEGADGVLSALGAPSLEAPGTVLSGGMANIVRGMRHFGVRRVVALAGSGVLDAPDGGLRHDQPGFPPIFRAISLEHLGTYRALEGSRLDWTLVCTPDLVDGERTDRVRAVADELPPGAARISVEDTAAFMLAQLGDLRFYMRRVGLAW